MWWYVINQRLGRGDEDLLSLFGSFEDACEFAKELMLDDFLVGKPHITTRPS